MSDIGKYTHPEVDAHIDSPNAHGAPAGTQLVYGADNTNKIFAPYVEGVFSQGDHWTHFGCVKPTRLRVGAWRVDDVRYRVYSGGGVDVNRYLTGPDGPVSKLVRFDPPFEFPPLVFLQQSFGNKLIIHPHGIGVDGFNVGIIGLEGKNEHTQGDPDWLQYFQFMWLAVEGTSGNWMDEQGRPRTWNDFAI